MKIRTQLIIIFILFLSAMIGIGIYSNYSLHVTEDYNQKLKDEKEMQRLVTHLQYRLAGISNDERGYLLTVDNSYTEGMKEKDKYDQQQVLEDLPCLVLPSKTPYHPIQLCLQPVKIFL